MREILNKNDMLRLPGWYGARKKGRIHGMG
jgi:hypothetical protein